MTAYFIEQKITALGNQYKIFGADSSSGQKKELIAFAHQKRFAFKEEITFYSDESKIHLIFNVKAEKVMDVHGKFVVTGKSGNKLGAVRKAFRASLTQSTWEVLDVNDKVMSVVQEKSANIAVFRRIWGIVPYLGEIPFFIKYHFSFINPSTKELVGNYEKLTRFRDHYKLEILNDGALSKVGWQTLVTQAVLLDALQGR
jgi:uncharacterized protein YxjI